MIWAALALLLSLAAQFAVLTVPAAGGRMWSGRLTYLSVLATLAALLSVLNARTPGGRVWAGLMAVLVLVFLIPWLEAPWRLRRAEGLAQLQLDAPWTIFYALVVLVGVTNYLPTRFGIAASWLALGLILEYLGLTRIDWPPEKRALLWSWTAWTQAMSIWTARVAAQRRHAACPPLERLWFWFRDHWGVVWGLRTLERFNRTAELKGWPIRLGWFGLEAAGPPPARDASALAPQDIPPEADAAFRTLVRRFAEPWRLDEVISRAVGKSCDGAKAER
jgi:hypothetical protein